MKNSFLDYQVFPIADFDKLSTNLAGANQRGVLIGLADTMTDDLSIFLKKIIAAAQLNLDEDCLTVQPNADGQVPSFTQLRTHQPFAKAVLFGISPKDLGLNIAPPQYFPVLLNGCTFLFVEKLAVIEPSKDRKAALWNCLKSMFL